MPEQTEIKVDIDSAKAEHAELMQQLQDPDTLADYKKASQINIKVKELEDLISTWGRYESTLSQLQQAKELSEDPELAELAAADLPYLQTEIQKLETHLREITAVKLPDDEKNAIIEIRAGTGGTEAALFAEEVLRMYTRYFTSGKFQVEQLHTSLEDTGGIKEAILRVSGESVYGKLRFESGVHRVQRVPVTEAKGRIHTSAISVVILPELEKSDVHIPDSEIRVDVYRSGGPGGQGVNRTDSAVRITHLPTNIVVTCQDSRSQHRNKDQALSILASKLRALQQEEEAKHAKDIRSASIQSGDRSAKIRTYNFPQGRITDHRISKSWFNISEVLEGEVGNIVKTVNTELRDRIASGKEITSEETED